METFRKSRLSLIQPRMRSIMNRIKELDLIRGSLWTGKLFCLNLFQGFSSYSNCNWVSPLNSPDRQRQGFIAIYLWKSFERIKPGGYQTTWTLRWPKCKHSVILYLLHYQYWRGCPYLTCVPLMISIQACNFNFLLDTDHYDSSSLLPVGLSGDMVSGPRSESNIIILRVCCELRYHPTRLNNICSITVCETRNYPQDEKR